jgi:hypothetical protein
MKSLLIAFGMVFALNSMASLTYSESKGSKPTDQEREKNHACFSQLSNDGCGDPGEDPRHFRSCMANVYPRLSSDCKKLMSDLYGSR